MEQVFESVARNVAFIFVCIGLGLIVGVYIRRFPKINFTNKLLSICIFFLLFFLGKSVGKDEAIMNSLGTIGLKALVITIGAILGSSLMAWFVYNRFFKQTMESNNANAEFLEVSDEESIENGTLELEEK